MQEIRAAIIGAGVITRLCHLPGYTQEGIRVVGLCDLRREAAETLAKQWPVDKIYTDWRQMLEEEKPDSVSVCLPNVLHEEPVIAALEMGAHVICEKPLATSVEQAERMFEAARRAGRHLMAGQQYRFKANTRVIKEAIDAGELGDIYYGEATALRRFGIPPRGGFHRRDMSAGGSLFDIGVHVLDQTLWLMGNPRPISVSAITARQFGHLPEMAGTLWDSESFDVEDFAVAFIRLEANRSILLRASWAAHLDHDDLMTTRLLGTGAGATTEPAAIFRLRGRNPTEERFLNVPQVNPWLAEIAHWATVLRGESEPLVTPEETLNVQKILNAGYDSAEKQEEIRLDLEKNVSRAS